MSNAATRHIIAQAVNRTLRVEGVIRADQMLRSYQRLVSLMVEFERIDSASALMTLVKLRMATRKAVPASEAAALTPVEVAVVEKVVAKRKSRAKKVVSRPGESIRDMLDLANSPCALDRNA